MASADRPASAELETSAQVEQKAKYLRGTAAVTWVFGAVLAIIIFVVHTIAYHGRTSETFSDYIDRLGWAEIFPFVILLIGFAGLSAARLRHIWLCVLYMIGLVVLLVVWLVASFYVLVIAFVFIGDEDDYSSHSHAADYAVMFLFGSVFLTMAALNIWSFVCALRFVWSVNRNRVGAELPRGQYALQLSDSADDPGDAYSNDKA